MRPTAFPRVPPRRATTARLVSVLLAVLVVSGARHALAIGRESGGWRGEDLRVGVDSRWVGNADGGYYPVRIDLSNNGPPCKVTFRFVPDEREDLPSASRSVMIDQNASTQITLLVPMTGYGANGWLRLDKNDQEVESFRERLTLAEPSREPSKQPSLLVIAPRTTDTQQFKVASTSLAYSSTSYSGGYSGGYHHGGSGPRPADAEVIPPSLLPETWVAYSGVDIVATPLETLASLPSEDRRPILDWVDTGGILLVYDVGGAPGESKRLADALGLDAYASSSDGWRPADPAKLQNIPLVEVQAGGGMSSTTHSSPPQTPDSWQRTPEAFARRDVMLGAVYAFPKDPFPGTAHDWAWLLQDVTPDRYHWGTRHGLSTRGPSNDFLTFLIPGTGGVPVVSFLVLMTVFTIVIGPLNYFWLWRRKRISLLLLTIPVLAFLTSLTLFAWSAVSAGFGVKSRVRSLTVLDQKSDTAVAISRVSLYAGVATSEGLKFSPETAVYPVWPLTDGYTPRTGSVDWSDHQALGASWFRSRTRTQFLTVAHRDQRGRIEVQPAADGTSLAVTNGLEWDLDTLLVRADDGRHYTGSNIAAGAAATLRRATPDDYSTLGNRLRETAPTLAPGAETISYSRPNRFHPRFGYISDPPQFSSTNSRMEKEIDPFDTPGADAGSLRPRMFFAVVAENPAIETGVEGAREQDSVHLMIGHY